MQWSWQAQITDCGKTFGEVATNPKKIGNLKQRTSFQVDEGYLVFVVAALHTSALNVMDDDFEVPVAKRQRIEEPAISSKNASSRLFAPFRVCRAVSIDGCPTNEYRRLD